MTSYAVNSQDNTILPVATAAIRSYESTLITQVDDGEPVLTPKVMKQ